MPCRSLRIAVVFAITAVSWAAPALANEPMINWHTDYGKAYRAQQEKQIPMVVFVMTEGCPYCHKMLESTYLNQHVAQFIGQRYVATVVNASEQQRLAQAFRPRLYPTTYLVGPDNRVVDRIEGFVQSDELQKRLTMVSRRYAKAVQTEQTR